MRIHVRSGLFRLWLVVAVLWATAVGLFSFQDVREEFAKAASMKNLDADGFVPDLPVDCDLARGSEFRRDRNLCWYDLPTFRKLYPEYKDLDDKDLSEQLYEKAGTPLVPIRPWSVLGERAGLALGPPLGLLAVGSALMWAVAGFANTGK
jgi:hypothetical protein